MQTIKNNKKAMANISRLRTCREAKGLTQSKLKEAAGLSNVKLIFCYEAGKFAPSTENYNKLARFFGWEIIEAPPVKIKKKKKLKATAKRIFCDENWDNKIAKAKKAEEEALKKEVQAREKALNFSFNEGECYSIDGFIFKYLGKQGIHHCFIEINGGWTRTYTDVQLIGRKIK